MDYPLIYWINFNYQFKGQSLTNCKGSACYSSLYSYLCRRDGLLNDLIFTLFMYNKMDNDPSIPNKQKTKHLLEFSLEDINYVFDKLEHIIDRPIIEEFTDEIGGGYTLTFDFKQKTYGYIKVVTTICRYFFEFHYIKYQGDRRRDMKDVLLDTINYCKNNPEASFIEMFQIMHYNVSSNGGHTLVSVDCNCCLSEIVSEKTFIKRMKDPKLSCVYSYRSNSYSNGLGVFDLPSLKRTTKTEEEYLKTINEITRI